MFAHNNRLAKVIIYMLFIYCNYVLLVYCFTTHTYLVKYVLHFLVIEKGGLN